MFSLRHVARAAPSAARAFTTTSPRAFARVAITGNLGDTPELQVTNTGREVVRFSVATSYGPRDNRKVNWYRVANYVSENESARKDYLLGLTKGSYVFVEGDLQIQEYQDAEGNPRFSPSVFSRTVEVLKRPNPEGRPEGQ